MTGVDSQLINRNDASKYPRDSTFYCQKTLGMQPSAFVDAAVQHVGVLDPGVRVVFVPEGQRHKLKGVGVRALLSILCGHEGRGVIAGSNSRPKKANGKGAERGRMNDRIGVRGGGA